MAISLYSFVTAVLWFSAFILCGAFLQRRAGFLFCYRLVPLLLLVGLTVVRLCVPIELPFTLVIHSTVFYPAVQRFLQDPLSSIGNMPISGLQMLLGIWATISVLLCGRLLDRIRRDSSAVMALPTVACPAAEKCLERLLSSGARARRVGLTVSPEVSSPMLVGLIRPTILLPAKCAELSGYELECVLRHELAHRSNGDLWVKLVIRLLCRIMWWNPCVYLLQRDLDSILEHKCDLTVTRAMGELERVGYLQTILDAFRRSSEPQLPPVVGVALCGTPGAVVAKRRFSLVLNQDTPYARRPVAIFAAALLALFVVSYGMVLQPFSSPPAEDLVNEIFVTPETSYILKKTDGSYRFINNGMDCGTISPETMALEAFLTLTIKQEERANKYEAQNTDYYSRGGSDLVPDWVRIGKEYPLYEDRS